MKTLNEIIDGLSNYPDLENEDIVQVNADIIVDALYHLKRYKDQREARDDQINRYRDVAKKCENILTDYVALQQYWWKQQENPPLTWDELRKMEGKPVFICILKDDGEWHGEWCLIEKVSNLMVETLRCEMNYWGFRKITFGKTWQAYRKERT